MSMETGPGGSDEEDELNVPEIPSRSKNYDESTCSTAVLYIEDRGLEGVPVEVG